MLENGVPLEVASNILGHSSIRVSADLCGHILALQRDKAVEQMANVL
jgi:intergrase/recombinase